MMKIRMRALKPFNRNLDGQMIAGHPSHPEPQGRFVHVTEASALVLENAGLAKRYSLRDETLDSLKASGDIDDDGNEVSEEERATATAGGRQSSTTVRERNNAGRQPPRKAGEKNPRRKAVKAGTTREAGIPVGGRADNATTSHNPASLAGDSLDQLADEGGEDRPDPDAAP